MGKNKAKKTAEKAKKVAPPPKPVEESESDDSSSEEEAPVKAPPAKSKQVKKPAKPAPVEESDDDSDDDEDSDESEEEVAPAKKAVPAKKAAAKKDEDSDEDSDDDDDDDDDDSEEDMDTAVSSALKKVQNGKQESDNESDDDDEDDDDDDEDESDDEDEQEIAKPSSKKAPSKTAKMEVDEDDSDDDEDSEDDEDDDDEDEEEEEEEEEDTSSKKRKAKKDKSEPPSKKAKPSEDDTESCTLFVKQLPASATEKKLKKKFSGVESVRIPMKPDGSHKGFAFLQFSSSAEVTKYLESHQGCDLDGSSLYLDRVGQKAQKNTPKKGGSGGEESNTLFVKNLPYEVTEGKLKKFFKGASAVRIPTDHEGNCKGFAYIEFASADEVETALEEKQGADFGGRALFLDKPRSRDGGNQRGGGRGGGGGSRGGFQRSDGPVGKTKVLFVKNLPFNLEKEELKEAFDGATDARIAIHRDTQKPRGFGYVEFNSVEDAESARSEMEGHNLKGREIHLDFARELSDSPARGGGRGGGGFRGGRGRGGDRGRGGFRGRGGDRGRGGFRGRGGTPNRGKGSIAEFRGTKKSFGEDSD